MFYIIYFVSDLYTVTQELLRGANYYRRLIEWHFKEVVQENYAKRAKQRQNADVNVYNTFT